MNEKPVTRRNFLKTAAITLGAGVVACSGLGYAATLAPQPAANDSSYGQNNTTGKRILVTYATRAGSTVDVAAAIGEKLAARGFSVDIKPVKEKPAISGYQAVLVGSAIRMGSWLPEAVDFVKTNAAALQQVPLAYFTVHANNRDDSEASRTARLAYLKDVRSLVQSKAEGFFAGKIDPATLSLLDQMILKMVKSEVGDFRDFTKIRAWAQTVLA
jgi:menaquinone-dependent protoporphyrinogen oxidase